MKIEFIPYSDPRAKHVQVKLRIDDALHGFFPSEQAAKEWLKENPNGLTKAPAKAPAA